MKYAMSYAWAKMGVLADVVNVTVLATSIVLQALQDCFLYFPDLLAHPSSHVRGTEMTCMNSIAS